MNNYSHSVSKNNIPHKILFGDCCLSIISNLIYSGI